VFEPGNDDEDEDESKEDEKEKCGRVSVMQSKTYGTRAYLTMIRSTPVFRKFHET